MNWRPIESAPKDYTKVLAYDPQICHHIVAYQDDEGVWLNDWKNGEFYPTHWMPLPPPPSTEPAPQDTGEKWDVVNEYGEHNLYFGKEYVGEVRFEEQGQEICAAMNLLAARDLSQVVVLDKAVVEKVRSALQYGCATRDKFTRELCHEALASLNAGGAHD